MGKHLINKMSTISRVLLPCGVPSPTPPHSQQAIPLNLKLLCYSQASSNISVGSLLEMQSLRPHCSPPESQSAFKHGLQGIPVLIQV